MLTPRFLLSAALALAFLPAAFGDTVTLKTGEKITGKITDDDAQSVTVAFKLSATINDSRTIAKTEIASIEKDSAEKTALEALQPYRLGINSAPAPSYEKAISALQSFVSTYPQSSSAVEVGDRLMQFADEKQRVEAGDIKIGGQWIAKNDVQSERYQINAQLVFAQMQETAAHKDYVGALNLFDQLEKSYSGARIFPDAVEAARPYIPALRGMLQQAAALYRARKAERDQGMQIASVRDQQGLKAAYEQEMMASNAALDAATKANVKWTPFQPANEKSFILLAPKLDPELKRLESLPVAKMRDSFKLSDKGLEQFLQMDLSSAQKSFQDARTLWSANEIAIRVQKEVAAQMALPKSTPEPATTAATPAPATPPSSRQIAKVPVATPVPTPELAPPAEPESTLPKPLIFGGLGLVVLVAVLLVLRKRKGKVDTES